MFIPDGRVATLSGFVPERFASAWPAVKYGAVEGECVEVVLSKAERDTALRKAALKRHGMKCLRCGFVPAVASQLGVYHKDSIAEGVRITTLDDVTMLCANCHRLTHHEMRQMATSV